jgi:DNA-binding response OmpR family regulator
MANILLVDDSKTITTKVTGLLEEEGHHVCVAHDGLQALNALYRYPDIDLLLLDVRLPHVDGFQLCRVIRTSSPCPTLPIIMLSGVKSNLAVRHALSLGANAYLAKPFEKKQLLEVINQQLEQSIGRTIEHT